MGSPGGTHSNYLFKNHAKVWCHPCSTAFRRSGASLAFNSNVDLDKIKQHGSWKSEAVCTHNSMAVGRVKQCVHIVITCSKTMQKSGAIHVVQHFDIVALLLPLTVM